MTVKLRSVPTIQANGSNHSAVSWALLYS